jgi:hypothetical protein
MRPPTGGYSLIRECIDLIGVELESFFRVQLLPAIGRVGDTCRNIARFGGSRMPAPVALFAIVLLVLPMGYFLLQAPAFLLVRLDDPVASGLLRGMFDKYYLALALAAAVGAAGFALDVRFVGAACIGAVAVFALAARSWFVRRMDAELRARDAGDRDAVRRLRRLHWVGMVCNVLQLALVALSVPYIADAA